MDLLNSDSDEDDNEILKDDPRLKINKQFASKYESSKRAKELQRAKYVLEEEEEDDSEDDESEDDDGQALSAALDLQIIKTISMVRKKDPAVYDKSVRWFNDDLSEDDVRKTELKHEKKTYKDVLREQLLNDGAEGDVPNGSISKNQEPRRLSTLLYDQEQKNMRNEFLKSIQDGVEYNQESISSDEENDHDGDEFLHARQKTADEIDADERELKLALDELQKLSQVQAPVATANSSVAPETIDADTFLINYSLKKKWKDLDSLPEHNDVDLEHEEEDLDRMDLFESKYNFRFEEMEAEAAMGQGVQLGQVKGYAREVSGSVRRDETKESRRLQRESRKERKEHERRQKEAEIRRLKNLKREEIMTRLRRIGDVGGVASLALEETVLDEDWDPDKHEAQMRAQFDDDYYAADDENFDAEREAAALEAEDWGQYDDGGWGEGEAENEADYGEEGEPEAEETSLPRQVEEELYKLDYEDLVAGIPCRFKYRDVPPESFGLTTDEILEAEDEELNKFVSLRKITVYRDAESREDERHARMLSKKRKRLRSALRERLEERSGGDGAAANTGGSTKDDDHDDEEEGVEVRDPPCQASVGQTGDSRGGRTKKARRKKKRRDGNLDVNVLDANIDGAASDKLSTNDLDEFERKQDIVAVEPGQVELPMKSESGRHRGNSRNMNMKNSTKKSNEQVSAKSKVKARMSLYS